MCCWMQSIVADFVVRHLAEVTELARITVRVGEVIGRSGQQVLPHFVAIVAAAVMTTESDRR